MDQSLRDRKLEEIMEFRPGLMPADADGLLVRSSLRSTRSAVTGTVAVIAAALLTWAGADARIPLEPVPITLQALFVLLAGAIIGPGRGCLSQMLYVIAGVAGVPLFAGALTGLAVLAGPTGGYLLGFIVTPLLVGGCIRRREDLGWTFLVFSAGAVTILLFGTLHLALFYTGSLPAAMRIGFLPFLPGDIAKVLAATLIYRACPRLDTRIG